MIDIQTYIEESLFSGQSAEDIAHNMERKLIIQPPKETVEDYLAWECVWIRLAYCISLYNTIKNPSHVRAYIDVPENVDLMRLFVDLFVANYKGLRLELSEQNLETICKESYVVDSIPLSGYDEKWDGLFELKQGESQQSIQKKLENIFNNEAPPAADGRRRYMFNPTEFCEIIIRQNQSSDFLKVLNGRANCLLRLSKLNGSRPWKMAVRKAYKTQLENIKKVLLENGVIFGLKGSYYINL